MGGNGVSRSEPPTEDNLLYEQLAATRLLEEGTAT